MCFSENISLAIGTIGILSSLYFYKKNIYASIGIGYFALMEILQFFQYKVINQCNNNYNKVNEGRGTDRKRGERQQYLE